MSDEEFRKHFKALRQKSNGGAGLLLILFLCFLNGCFKGCGY